MDIRRYLRHHRVASKKIFWLVTAKLSLATRLVS